MASKVLAAPVHNEAEIESALSAIAREPNCGLIVMGDPFTTAHRREISTGAVRYRLPAIYPERSYVDDGGLFSYGFDWFDHMRQAAGYVNRILRGENPADLPVQAPVKYELIVNLKAANAISLTIPETFLVRADRVIE